MSRSFTRLRRGLLGIAFVGSVGFGATTAFAETGTTERAPTFCMPESGWCWCMGDCVLIGHCNCEW
jgi:hypothetical protein